MPPADPSPQDPRERKRPKDSEFYQIPPDLKKEFEIMMAGRGTPTPADPAVRTSRYRRNLALASLWMALAGVLLIGVGPLAAIILGFLALRSGSSSGGEPPPAAARAGVALGFLVLLVNAVTVLLAWRLRSGI
jgi:hypothetical protein